MATKRVSPDAKTAKRKRTAPTPEATHGIATTGSDPVRAAAGATPIDPEVRRQQVAAEAYLLAERRGFAAGRELEDWVAAEAVVDSRLQQSRVA
ncbi:MAG: DUF2934 domain-containing protein [Steroidobacteraceae bacterium]|jgi:hypothetical protein